MKPSFGDDYRFRWDDLGDIVLGRPHLGQQVSVAIYRLANYTMREALVRRYGEAAATDVFREAGWIAGHQLCLSLLDRSKPFPAFISELQAKLRELGIGVLRIERADLDRRRLTLTMSEDLECSGLPISGTTTCEYDEGFIAGVLHAYTGDSFDVSETDCWTTGDRTCRFEARCAEPARS